MHSMYVAYQYAYCPINKLYVLGWIQTEVDQDGVLLCCELLEEILIRRFRRLLPLRQTVTQTILLEEEEPHLTSPTFGDTYRTHTYKLTDGNLSVI